MQTEKQETKVHELFDCFNQGGKKELIDEPNKIDLIDKLKELNRRSSYIGQVTEFMEAFKQEIEFTPIFPTADIIELRLALLLEEVSELAEACGTEMLWSFISQLKTKTEQLSLKIQKDEVKDPNLVEVFDALLDTQYVLSGAVNSFGMAKVFDTGFENVHESNMSKACSSFQEAVETQKHYKAKGVESTIDVTDWEKGIWRVFRKDNKKLLKSVNYNPSDLNDLIYPPITNQELANNA